jgi:hypothetical protein
MIRQTRFGREALWFVVLPLALAAAALLIQHAVQKHRRENLWSQMAPPPPARR